MFGKGMEPSDGMKGDKTRLVVWWSSLLCMGGCWVHCVCAQMGTCAVIGQKR